MTIKEKPKLIQLERKPIVFFDTETKKYEKFKEMILLNENNLVISRKLIRLKGETK